MKNFLINLSRLLFLSALPFFVLIRGAVFLHEQYRLFAWFSLLGGMLAGAFLLFLYIAYWQSKVKGRPSSAQTMKRQFQFTLSITMIYCIPGVLFLSAANAKHPEVQKEFRSLHPILRLGVSTLIFLDNDLVVTDADRQPEDYRRMNLPGKRHSLHYRQEDGYTHAIDIRTSGRTSLRNACIAVYFRLMGFRTLRHVGTADHLHVSLLSHDRPGGK